MAKAGVGGGGPVLRKGTYWSPHEKTAGALSADEARARDGSQRNLTVPTCPPR